MKQSSTFSPLFVIIFSFLALLAVQLVPMIVLAGEPESSDHCSAEAIKKKRNEFNKLYNKKEYAAGIKVLNSVIDECGNAASSSEKSSDFIKEQICWSKSDLGLALYKSGDYFACRSKLGFELDPRNTCGDTGDGPVPGYLKAIERNYDLCTKKGILASQIVSKCPLPMGKNALASLVLGNGKNAGDSCLVLLAPDKPKENSGQALSDKEKLRKVHEDGDLESTVSCPKLALLKREGSAKVSQTVLSVESTILNDESSCCSVGKMSWYKKGDKKYIYLFSDKGPTSTCDGSGTMRVEPSALYEWDGVKLKEIEDTSWGTH